MGYWGHKPYKRRYNPVYNRQGPASLFSVFFASAFGAKHNEKAEQGNLVK